MTGRPVDSDSDWDGPEWAAPARAERIASCPRARPGGADFPLRLLVHKYIVGSEYMEMRRMEARYARANRARGIPRRGEGA